MSLSKAHSIARIQTFLNKHAKYSGKDLVKLAFGLLEIEPSTKLKVLCFLSEHEAKSLNSKIIKIKEILAAVDHLPTHFVDKLNQAFDMIISSANKSLDHPSHTDGYDLKLERLVVDMSAFINLCLSNMASNNSPTLSERLEYIALLAPTFGGLAFERPLKTLLSKIIDEKLTFYELPQGIGVDLPYRLSGHPTDASLTVDINIGERLYNSILSQMPKGASKKAEPENDTDDETTNNPDATADNTKVEDTSDSTETTTDANIEDKPSIVEPLNDAYSALNKIVRVSKRYWYPDPLTSFAIAGYFKKTNHEAFKILETAEEIQKFRNENQVILTPEDVISSLKRKFKKFSGKTMPSSKQFFNACFLAGLKIGEQKAMPYFLGHYARGNLASASLPIQSIAAIHKLDFAQPSASNQQIEIEKLNQWHFTSSTTDNIDNIRTLHDIREICIAENITIVDGLEAPPLQSRKVTIERLRDILNNRQINIQTEIFLKWLLFNLEANKWEYGKRTTGKYVSAIGDVWLDYWINKKIFEYDPDDMQEAFEYMCWEKRYSNKLAPLPLSLLFDFIGKNYSSISIPDVMADQKTYHHVRSDFVPEHHFQRLRFDMQRLYSKKPDHFKLSVDALLIIIRRAFLRPIEAYSLQLDDIQVSDQIHLRYRKNEYAGYKTDSAKRNFELSLLLKPDEIKILMKYLRWRRRNAGANKNALLFSKSLGIEQMFDRETINAHAIEFLSSYAGRRIAFYSMRHSGISAMQLVQNGEEEFASLVSGYTIAQIQKIKASLQTRNLGSNYQVSGLAGHLSATMTISVYSHFTDYLLHNSIMNKEWTVSKRLLVNLLSERSKYISGLSTSKNVELYEKNTIDVAKIVNKKHIIKIRKPESLGSPNVNVYHRHIFLEPWDCQTVLSLYDANKSIAEIRASTEIPLWLIGKIVEAGKNIKSDDRYVTRRKQSRLFTKGSDNLCPINPVHRDEREDRVVMLKNLSSKYFKRSPYLNDAISRVLSSASDTRSEVLFQNPADMKVFLKFLSPIIPINRWSAQFEITLNILYRWKSIVDDIVINKVIIKEKLDKNSKNGRCTLKLFRAEHYKKWDKSEVNVSLDATNSLKSACHLIAIFIKMHELIAIDANLKEKVDLEMNWGEVSDFVRF
jgi:hypothetical protein